MSQVYDPGARSSAAGAYDEAGQGWVIFAGLMLLIVGVMNVIYGIAAIDNSSFYVQDAKYIFSDLNTWGWILLVVGVVQCGAGFGIWARNGLARWIGVISASVNAIIQLMFLPAFPLASLALFSIDILVIYGLLAYARRTA